MKIGLDGLQLIVGCAGNRFIVITAIDKDGNYQKLEFSFDRFYQSYTLRQGIVDGPELNIAVLPKGVCATIVDDGKLNIFVPSNGTLNSVEDKYISTDMTLANWGDKVVYIENGKLWHVRMK